MSWKIIAPYQIQHLSQKIIEKVISGRLNEHLLNNSMFDPLQWTYRDKHSTETVLIKVQNDILSALDPSFVDVVCPLPLNLVRSSRFWSASQLIHPSGQQLHHSSGGLSTNTGVPMRCVCGWSWRDGVCRVCVLQRGNSGDGFDLASTLWSMIWRREICLFWVGQGYNDWGGKLSLQRC